MNNYQPNEPRETVNTQIGLNSFLTRMYGFMSLAVLVSAISAWASLTVFRAQVFGAFAAHPGIMLLVYFGITFGIVIAIPRNQNRNPALSFSLLMLFAVVFGAVMSVTLAFYTAANIAGAFVAAAGVFGAMTFIGTTTKRDMSRLGTHMIAALIGLLVASVVNMFLRSAMITYIFSYIGVLIFAGLSLYDANRMRDMYLQYGDQVSATGLAVTGALQLYLDFVNLFLYFLQIFGGVSNRD